MLALVARFPELVSWVPGVADAPVFLPESLAWLSSNPSLAILLALSLLEAWAESDPDAREIWARVESLVRAAAGAFAAFALLDSDTRALVDQVTGAAPGSESRAPAAALAIGAGVLVHAASRLRARALEPVRELDADGSLGLGRLVARVEDCWAAGGMALALLAPLLAIVAALALLALALGISRRADARAEKRREPCAACGARVRRESAACLECGGTREPTEEASSRWWPDQWLLAAREGAAVPSEVFRALELLAEARCPRCAERRPPRELVAAVPHRCGWPGRGVAEAGVGWPAALDSHVRARGLRLLPAAALMGLVPIAGAAAAAVVARLRISQPLRQYLPRRARLLNRWACRLIVIVLLPFSVVPLASVLVSLLVVMVPLLAWRRSFRRHVVNPERAS